MKTILKTVALALLCAGMGATALLADDQPAGAPTAQTPGPGGQAVQPAPNGPSASSAQHPKKKKRKRKKKAGADAPGGGTGPASAAAPGSRSS
jgi:hypothetical protein